LTSNEEAIECTRACLESNEDIGFCFINCVIGNEFLFEAKNGLIYLMI